VPVFAAGAGAPGAAAAQTVAPAAPPPADLASHLGPVLQPEAAVASVWSLFALLAVLGGPLLFGMVFVAVWVLLAWISVCLWLRRWRVVADLSGVRVRWSILGVGWTRRVAPGEIEAIAPRIFGEFGSRLLYDLEIRRRRGRRVKLADGIRSKREAEWLCAAIAAAVRG
jgi:hypothetical protein